MPVQPILFTTATSSSTSASTVTPTVTVYTKIGRGMATPEEVKDNKKEVAKYTQKDFFIQQYIFRTVTDRMMLQISS
jgi:hypothetical protein